MPKYKKFKNRSQQNSHAFVPCLWEAADKADSEKITPKNSRQNIVVKHKYDMETGLTGPMVVQWS